MKRNLKEILFLLMQIEQNFSRFYRNVSEVEGQYSNRLRTISAVLSREEDAHCQWYGKLLEEGDLKDVTMDEEVYEAARKNLEAFKQTLARTKVPRERDILQFAYDYEIRNAQTLWNIYGHVKEYKGGEQEIGSRERESFLKLLEDLIRTEETHAANLKQFMKNGSNL